MTIGGVLDAIPSSVMSFIGNAIASQLSTLVRIDHPMTHEFAVEIDGFVSAGFVKVEGLSDRATPLDINSVTSATKRPIFPYKRQIGMVTLNKGISYQGQFEEWYYGSQNWQIGDKSPLKDVDFIQLQRMDSRIPYIGGMLVEVKRWKYPRCVCRDYTAPKWGALKSDISSNDFIIQTTRPELIEQPTNFGSAIGFLLDAIKK